MTPSKPGTTGGYKFAPLVDSQTILTSEPARRRLLWAIRSLVFPVTFGHPTTACRSPVLTFSAHNPFRHETFRPLFRRSAPFPLVLGCSSRPLVGGNAEIFEVVQGISHPLFSPPPHAARARHQFSEHHSLRQSRVLHARNKAREQDPPPAHNRLGALTCRHHDVIMSVSR